ncbi:hypothetical protein [Actinomadura violacea]|uniref:Uncharacterized protein n=1 Tax=Actinomadura violacea TaxID=2819934 RepID=A0ABS3S0D2_9ACTN|nr:hypothetical protein [Actinomadura violacea]MBO2461725.1 hypothetical protein [Actinomadura violacea]
MVIDQTPYDEMMAAALTVQSARLNALDRMQGNTQFWGSGAHKIDTSCRFYRGLNFSGASAVGHLAGMLTPAAAGMISEDLRRNAVRWRDEVVTDTAECSCCDGVPGCGHPRQQFHVGGEPGAGCGQLFGDGAQRCTCFDAALNLAREVNALGQEVTRFAVLRAEMVSSPEEARAGEHAHLVGKKVRVITITGGTLYGVLGASTRHGVWIGDPDDGSYLAYSQVEHVVPWDGEDT